MADNITITIEVDDKGSAKIQELQRNIQNLATTVEGLPENLTFDIEATDAGSAVADGFQDTVEGLPENLTFDIEATDAGSAVADGFQDTVEGLPENLTFDIEATDAGSAVADGFQDNLEGLSDTAEDTSETIFNASTDMADDIETSSDRGKSSIGDLDSALQSFGLNTKFLTSVGIAGAITAAVGISIGAFAEWEQSLFSIQDATGKSKREVDNLGAALRTMSTDTMNGAQSADTLAAIAAEGAGKLKLSADTDILAFTQAVASIASTTNLSKEQAVAAMVNLEQTFKQSLEATGETAASQSENIASAINTVASDETFGPIAELTDKIGAIAQQFGLSAADVVGFSATLINAGVDTGRGSQAIKNLLGGLQADSRSFADAFQIDAKSLATALETDPKKAIDLVITAMGDLSKTEGPAALAQRLQDLGMGGGASADVFARLSTVTTELDANMQKANEGFQQGGAFQAELSGQAETLSGTWTRLWNSVKDLSSSFGQQLNPAVSGVSGALAGLATNIANTLRPNTVNAFFDRVVGGWNDLQSVNLGEIFAAVPGMFQVTGEQIGQTEGKLLAFGENLKNSSNEFSQVFGAGIVSITQGVAGIGENVGTLVGDMLTAQTSVGEVIGAIPGMFVEIGRQIGITQESIQQFQQTVNLLGEEKPQIIPEDFSTKASESIEVLSRFGAQYKSIIDQSPEFEAEYTRVFKAVEQAQKDNMPVSAALIRQMNGLRDAVVEVEDVAVTHSTFPAMIEAEEAAKAKTAELTGEMAAQTAQVATLGAAYEPIAAKVKAQEDAVKAVTAQITRLRDESVNASAYQQVQIGKQIELLNNERQKRQEVLTDIKQQTQEAGKPYEAAKRELEKLEREVEKADDDEEKAVQRVADAREKATDWLTDQQQKSSDAMQKHLEDEAEKNREIQDAQRDRAQESLGFIGQLSAETKQRLLAEGDVVANLEAQGIHLDAMQQEQARILQNDYQRTAALDDQAQLLEKQLGTTVSLSDAFKDIGNDLKTIGDAFDIEGLGQIGQGLGQLPDIFKGIKDSMSDLPGAFGQVKGGIGGLFSGDILGGLSGLVGGFSGITGAIGALSAAWSVGKTVWAGIKSLFKESKSEGEKSTEAWQNFVDSMEGANAGLADAIGQARDSMDFGDQFASLTADTYNLWNAFANTPIEGTTTGLDMLRTAMEEAGVETEKLDQVAIQTFAAMQEQGLGAAEMAQQLTAMLGLTADQATTLAQALTGTTDDTEDTASIFDRASNSATALSGDINSLSGSLDTVTDQMSNSGTETRDTGAIFDQAGLRAMMLGGDIDDLSEQLGLSADEVEELRDMLLDLPDHRDIAINLTTTGQVPALAAGGDVGRTGLAIVNEAGFEAARFPGGLTALLTATGPVLGAFPVGTEIIPHYRTQQLLQQYPNLPRMATGGMVTETPTTIRDGDLTVNIYASVIDRGTIRMIETELNRLKGNRTGK